MSDNQHFEYDFFISHASEDKDDFVRPLAEALQATGHRVWYDEFAISVGDSIRAKIAEGLRNSRYGVVVLSQSFFKKRWPARELGALYGTEGRILPIWHQIGFAQVYEYDPMLVDVQAILSERPMEEIVAALSAKIKNEKIPEETFGQLIHSSHLEQRVRMNPDLKIAMARNFVSAILPGLLRSNMTDLFVESGSTLSYVANTALGFLQSPWLETLQTNWTVRTNSAFIALEILSGRSLPHLRVQMLEGFVDQRYGASIPSDNPEAIENKFLALRKNMESGVALMTSSGFVINNDQFGGPTVGTIAFRSIKRGLLKSRQPTILFTDETKVHDWFSFDRVYPVAKNLQEWQTFCAEVPLGLFFSARSDRIRQQFVSNVAHWGFRPYGFWWQGNGCFVAFVCNDIFPDILLNSDAMSNKANSADAKNRAAD